jgi:hypothetical protein
VSTGKAVERVANQRRREIARSRQTIGGNPIRGLARSERQAISSLSQLRAQNPQAYDEKGRTGIGADLAGALHLIYGRRGAGPTAATVGGAALAQHATARAVARDVQSLGESPFVGGYQLGAAAYEASPIRDVLGGRSSTARAERLGRGLLKGLAASAPGELLQGHPGKALAVGKAHPLIATLDFAAAASVAGKLAGSATRVATGYKVGSTVRPPVALSNDAGAVKAGSYRERKYAKGWDRQGVQRYLDSRREPVTDAQGKPVTVKQAGRDVPVLRATPGELRRGNIREADYRIARGNADERRAREVEARSLRIRGIRRKQARDLVAMVHEGTIPSLKHIDPVTGHVMTGPSAFRRYLLDHADRLDREYAARMKADPAKFLHSGKKEENRYNAKLARDAAANPKIIAQAEKIVAAGTRSGKRGRLADIEAHGVGVITDLGRAKGAALIPGKIAHLGGRHFTEREHAHLEREALKEEERIKDALLGVERSGGSGPGGVERRTMSRIPDTQRRMELQRELAAARAHRIAVSGRDPRGVRAHEAADEAHKAASETAKKVGARVARLVQERKTKIGVHRSERGRGGPHRAYVVAGKRFERRDAAEKYAKEKPGREVRVVALTKDEAARIGEIERLDRAIKAAKEERAEAETAARKAKHELKRTPKPPIREAVRTAEGKHLPDEAIERWYRDRGRDPDTVGYLPHTPPRDSAYHQQLRPGSRATADKPGKQGTRTGEAYRAGATEASADLIEQQGVSLRTKIVQARQLDHLVRERGLRHPRYAELEEKAARGESLTKAERRLVDNHGYWTGKEAAEVGTRVLYDTSRRHGKGGLGPREVILLDGERYVPMIAHPDRLSDATKRVIHEDLQGPGAMESLHEHLLNDRILEPDNLKSVGSRNVVLVPADTVDRYLEHLRPAGDLEKMLQMLNRPFRFAVLSQFKWLVGNFVEPYFVRLPTVGSGVVNVPGMLNDIRISMKIVREGLRSGDPRVRAAAEARVADDLGGLLNNRGASNRRLFTDTKLYAKMVQKVPATRQMYEIVHKLGQVLFAPARAFFWANREAIEKWAQHAQLGRSERQAAQEFFGSWKKAVRFGKEATEEALRGLSNTPRQHAFMREQYKLLGQYGGFNPRLRALVQGPMPFLPWALNAARFVYWTMPTQRTIVSSLLIKTNDVVSDEWKKQHASLSPKQAAGTLGIDPVRKDGGITPVIRYTPYGLTEPILRGDLEGADYAFPAFSGVTAALQGKDPFGNDLKAPPSASNPQGTVTSLPAKGAVAANSLAEALVPYLAQIRRLREHGETGYSTSNVIHPKTKPGTSYGMTGHGVPPSVFRALYPFRPTYLRAAAARATCRRRRSRARSVCWSGGALCSTGGRLCKAARTICSSGARRSSPAGSAHAVHRGVCTHFAGAQRWLARVVHTMHTPDGDDLLL